MLKRLSGVECPNCGCEDSDVVSRGRRWGKPVESRSCSHCGKRFRAEVKEGVEVSGVVVYKPSTKGGATCPRCGRFPVRVASSGPAEDVGPRVRAHKCACGWVGKSVEE